MENAERWKPDWLMIFLACVFAACVHVAHFEYLAPRWPTAGFQFHQPPFWAYAYGLVLIALVAAIVPRRIDSPVSIVVVPLFILTFIPTVVITISNRESAADHHAVLLLSLAASMSLAGFVARLDLRTGTKEQWMPGDIFVVMLVAWWLASAAVLVYVYADKMAIVGFDEVYGQRVVGSAATGRLIGYVQTYFLAVINPVLIAYGLIVTKRWPTVLLGFVGSLLIYAIDAQKTALFLPFVIVVLCGGLRIRLISANATALALAAGSVAVLAGVVEYKMGYLYSYYSGIVVSRVVGIPAQTFGQYYEVFSDVGFTWWSHVRGIASIIEAPGTLRENVNWPQLGRIVGEHQYGDPGINANANLFVSDGVAAAGMVGILAIGAVFSLWLYALSVAARGWNREFATLFIAPVGIALLNSPFFTTMLSFGGIFVVLTLMLGRFFDRSVPEPMKEQSGTAA